MFEKFSLFKTPFPGRSSVPTSFVSFFVFYIFSYLLSKTMGCFSGCLMSSATFRSCFVEFIQPLNVLLMNLWGRNWSPHPIPPPSSRPHMCNTLIEHTGVCSLSLLQGIFPTQELNWGLLHCRCILYQLSYEGSPRDSTCNH